MGFLKAEIGRSSGQEWIVNDYDNIFFRLSSLISLSTRKNSPLKERERDWSRNVSNFIALIPSRSVLSNGGNFFWSWIIKDCISKFRKIKWMPLSCVRVLLKTPCEISRCNNEVAQWWQRNVQKSVRHVQSCRFANQKLFLFAVLVDVAVVVASLVTIPEVFATVNQAQFPSRFSRWCYTGRFATTIFAQHSITMLEQCCNHLNQCRDNVAKQWCARNRCCESSGVASPLSGECVLNQALFQINL